MHTGLGRRLEDVGRAIAMVDIEIDDRHAFQSMHGQSLGSAYGDVVEQAETHGDIARGVMTGWANRAERAPRRTRQ